MDAFGVAGRATTERTAKACGPDLPTLGSSSWIFLRATVAIKPGHRGERAISRKTIAQGRPECFGVPVFTRVLSAFYLAREAAGAIVHPAFPAPSIFEGSGWT